MDVDGGVQDGVITAFSSTAPLPFRVLFLVAAGILCWALNLHGLYLFGIDTSLLFDGYVTSSGQSHLTPTPGIVQPPYNAVYRLFTCYIVATAVGWCTYSVFTNWGEPTLVDSYRFIPIVCIIAAVLSLFVPIKGFYRRERRQFLQYENFNLFLGNSTY
jgi:hypothetical protein